MTKKTLSPNTMLYPNPVVVIATYGEDGRPNAATFAWSGVASSDPPSISVAVQPVRTTWQAIKARGCFTANLVPSRYAAHADYFGIAAGRDTDKFADTGLTPCASLVVDAPYVGEFAVALECEVTATLDLGRHTLFVGAVRGIIADEDVDFTDVLCWDASTREYFTRGPGVAKSFEAGLKFRKKQ